MGGSLEPGEQQPFQLRLHPYHATSVSGFKGLQWILFHCRSRTLRSCAGEMVNPGLKDVCLAEISKEMKYQVRPATWDWVTKSNPLVGRIPGQLNPNNEQIALIQAMDHLVRERAVESNTAVRTSPMDIGVGTKQAVTSLRFVPRRPKIYLAGRVRVANSQLRRE